MIRNIIVALVGFVIVALLVLWILNGGIGRAVTAVKNFSFTSGVGGGFTLPWQPAGFIPRIGTEDLFPGGVDLEPGSPEAELARLQEEYSEVESGVREFMTTGNPSPHFGKVTIGEMFSGPREQRAESEFVTIEAAYSNESPISLAGWSLESALSGLRAPLPSAASPFWMGAVNTLDAVLLAPGHSGLVSTGASPVGVSFRENVCTGYLSQFQSFSPPLSLHCPAPHEELSLSVETLQQYGSECVDALTFIPTCQFPNELPAALSPACRAHLQTILSYNGCVGRHSSDTAFAESSWRLFLGSPRELWRNTHDALRLLDAEGRVVDVYVY